MAIKPPHHVEKIKHKCSCCAKDFFWSDESRWYGNYKVHGVGYQGWDEPNVKIKVCSETCFQAMKDDDDSFN